MITEIKNIENKAGQAMVEAIGGKLVRGIAQGRRDDLKKLFGNMIVDGYVGCARAEGYIALDASLATPEQAESLYMANIMGRGKPIEVFLRWYVIFHVIVPNRVITRLVKAHNAVVPERYHVKAKLTERGYIELHHSEPLLRGYIDGDPCNVGLTTWVACIDPLHHFAGNDIPLWHIMESYERLSPDWAGHREYDTYLWDSQARELAHWPENYWYAEVLTPQHYKDLFNAYWRDSVQRRLTVKYGRKVKPLTLRK